MKVFTLTTRIVVDLKDTPSEEIERRLALIPNHAAGEGWFTGNTSAEAESWGYTVTVEDLKL